MPSNLLKLQPFFENAVQQAAEAVQPFVGQGDKIKIDGIAVQVLRDVLNKAPLSGTIIIGEGEADEAPHLYNGEKVGAGGVEIDIAVDPVDGTTNAANGTPNAVCLLAASPKGSMLSAPDIKMQKLISQPLLDPTLFDLNQSWEVNFYEAAQALGKPVSELNVCFYANERYPDVLNRDAHLYPTLKKLGIQVLKVPNEWPQIPALCRGEIDLICGVGGAPETVASTAALIQAGAHIQAQFYADKPEYFKDVDFDRIYGTYEIINATETLFAMAPITPSIPIEFE